MENADMAKNRPKRDPSPESPASGPPLDHIAESLRPLAVPLADLHLDPQNARTHDENNLQAIAGSLKRFGQVKPIVAHRETGAIEAGNGTYLAAQRLEWTHLAVVYVEHDAAAARGFSIADNRTAELAAWDEEALGEMLDQVQEDAPELFRELLLDQFLAEEEAEEEEPYEKTPPTSAYQVIVECTDAKDRERLVEKLRKEGRQCHVVTWT
jgi:hypothetical protein